MNSFRHSVINALHLAEKLAITWILQARTWNHQQTFKTL